MNLSGSLRDFALPDVLALLVMTSKTGVVHVRSGGNAGVVVVREGTLAAAAGDDRRQALARRLVSAGLVDEPALVAAVESAKAGGGSIAQALLAANAVDEAAVQQAAEAQVVDGLLEILEWTDGDFEFVVGEAGRDDVGVTLPLETVLDAARARDRMNALLAPLEGLEARRSAVPDRTPSYQRPEAFRPSDLGHRDSSSSLVPDSLASLVAAAPRSRVTRTGTVVTPTAGSSAQAPMPTVGATAVKPDRVVAVDPAVSRAMLLRLIAGVKGL